MNATSITTYSEIVAAQLADVILAIASGEHPDNYSRDLWQAWLTRRAAGDLATSQWVAVESLVGPDNKRKVIKRFAAEDLGKAFAYGRKRNNCVVVTDHNIADDAEWVWGDIRLRLVMPSGVTASYPA